MKIDIAPACCGKTTRLISDALSDNKSVIIVADQSRKRSLLNRCQQLSSRVYTIQEVLRGFLCVRKVSQIFIDDIDVVLSNICNMSVSRITFRPDDNVWSDSFKSTGPLDKTAFEHDICKVLQKHGYNSEGIMKLAIELEYDEQPKINIDYIYTN